MASVLRNERYRASDLTAGQSSAVEDVAYLVFGVFGKLVEGAVARTIVGQSVGVDPWAIHVAEQVVGRLVTEENDAGSMPDVSVSVSLVMALSLIAAGEKR